MLESNLGLGDKHKPSDARDGMIFIPGGTFLMGSDKHYPEEAPLHRVTVDGFRIDRTRWRRRNTQLSPGADASN
jgi:sulfatase modifying factor 1